MSQTLTKPILLDETGQAIKTALQNIDETESQDWLLTYEDVHSEMDDNINRMADTLEEIKDIMQISNSEPVEIKVVTPPTKTEYTIDETFDPAGMVVCVNMSNGITSFMMDISDAYTYTPPAEMKVGNNYVLISWSYKGQTFTTTQKIIVPPPSWSDGTDEELATILAAHYNGEIDLTEFWSIGDERTVHLSAMSVTGVGESHVAQDVTFILTNAGGKTLADGVTECCFQVDQKDCLNDTLGYINSTATHEGMWKECARRTWCNNVYKNALPSTFLALFKEYQNECVMFNDDGWYLGQEIVNDFFALRGVEELDGISIQVYAPESGGWTYIDEGKQAEYYIPKVNRFKNVPEGQWNYWTRTPARQINGRWQIINQSGGDPSENTDSANKSYGIAPFGVI